MEQQNKNYDYQILQATSKRELENEVYRARENGWNCQGGVCVTSTGGFMADNTYSQAMVKE